MCLSAAGQKRMAEESCKHTLMTTWKNSQDRQALEPVAFRCYFLPFFFSLAGQCGLLYFEIRFRSLGGTVLTRGCVSLPLLLISAAGHTDIIHQHLSCPGACSVSWGVTYSPQSLLRAFGSAALKPFAYSPESEPVWSRCKLHQGSGFQACTNNLHVLSRPLQPRSQHYHMFL